MALSQPLGLRRDYGKDYDEVDSSMVKPLPPAVPPTLDKALKDNVVDLAIPSLPQGLDYDSPTPVMVPDDKGCGGPIMGPATNSMDLECPYCRETNKFIPDGDEDIEKEVIILCPKCANSSHISDFIKTASGKYTAKTATCLDNDFKAIRRILPKKDEITISGKDIRELHKRLDKIYETYRQHINK